MTRRIDRILLAALLACLFLPLAAPEAAACDVGYGYRGTMNFGKDLEKAGRRQSCSNGTSLAGVGLVALLTIGALTAAGAAAVRRGQAKAASLSPDGAAQALTDYLEASRTTAPAPDGNDDAVTTP